MFDYLKDRWSQSDLRQYILFNHVVHHVTYNDDTDNFSVVVKNLPEDKDLPAQKFDYVIVASGHFSVPNIPYYNGIDQFPGRIIHAHDVRDASQFKNQSILLVGAGYSAEDIALQSLKYGAKMIIISYRTWALGYQWPPEIEERPLVTKIEGNTVHFKDNTTADVDSIILCTGYIHHFPFMEERLRLKTKKNLMYHPGLYKCTLWCNGGNNKLLYMAMQELFYTFSMIDVQAKWALDYIIGDIKLPDKKDMEDDIAKWIQRLKDEEPVFGELNFQRDYVADLAKEANYGYDLDISGILRDRIEYVVEHCLTYREKCYTSKFSGVKSTSHHTTFMNAFDDSIETFIK